MLLALATGGRAQASGTEEHRALMVAGQLLRADGKLLRARDLLESCEHQVCDSGADEECASIRVFCKNKLTELTAEIPRISIVVADDLGTPLPKAKAWVDNTLVAEDRTMLLDPGHHLLRADYLGRLADVDFEVKRGEPPKTLRATIDLRRTVTERPVPKLAFGLSALSALGLIGFGVLGASAESQASGFSDCKPTCDQSKKSSFDTMKTASDVSLGVGVVGALAATIVFLSRPRVETTVRLEDNASPRSPGGAR